MKKIFPAFIVLIAAALIGLIYLQIQWIDSALEIQRLNYQNELQNSAFGIRRDLVLRVAAQRGYNPDVIELENETNLEYLTEKLDKLSYEDFEEIIRKHLLQNNIDLEFGFALVKDRFGGEYYALRSSNFKQGARSLVISMDTKDRVRLHILIVEPDNYILKRSSWMVFSSIIFTLVILSAFIIILRMLYRQKKVGEIKSDFINNMTHEFKTPLATISLAVDALNSPKILDQPEKIKYFAGIIKDENTRMNKQVQKILEAAKMEKDNIELNLQPLHVHEYIQQAANNSELRVGQKDGTIELHLNAKNDMVEADEVHLSNIIFNLLDNAIKYCDKVPRIQVYTSSNRNNFIIKVEDNGIGMNKDTLAHIFEKFYRAHTGNIHNVKGFGLGLSYVKAVVEAHKGKIKAESTPGKGSIFIIELPLLKH